MNKLIIKNGRKYLHNNSFPSNKVHYTKKHKKIMNIKNKQIIINIKFK